MFIKYPFSLYVAPKKDGVFVVKHQGRVRYIGVAFEKETGRNLKQEVKFLYRNPKGEVDFMQSMRELTSVHYIPMNSYEEALEEREKLILKHKKSVGKYHS